MTSFGDGFVARRLVTGAADGGDTLAQHLDVGVRIKEGRITALGPRQTVFPDGLHGRPTFALVTPGLVDAHTHAAYCGSRAEEYARRLAGADYETIAAAGGGIVSSMAAVRDASDEVLTTTLRQRLIRMAALGVTTVEIKSGYGLNQLTERRLLEAIARCGQEPDLPRIVATYLGLHAVPKDFSGSRCDFAAAATAWLEPLAADGLVDFVDAYIDRSAFSVDQARVLCTRAKEIGLGVRLHVGQFADVGGAEFAAEIGAASADHLEVVSSDGAQALADAGVVAGLLPVAAFTLRQEPPPIAALRQAGVRMLVASDANPGTAPTDSLPLAMSMAAVNYGLTLDEILLGTTTIAAASLGLGAVGTIAEGKRADFVAWDLDHEAALLQPWGTPKAKVVVRDGALISGALARGAR